MATTGTPVVLPVRRGKPDLYTHPDEGLARIIKALSDFTFHYKYDNENE